MADSLLSQRRMLTTSARDKYGNRIRGQGIRSAETAQAESDFRAQALRGLANIQRRSLLSRVRGEQGTTRGLTPPERYENMPQSGVGSPAGSPKPMSQLYADQRKSRMEYYARIQGRQPATTGAAPAPAAAPAAAPGAMTIPATTAPKPGAGTTSAAAGVPILGGVLSAAANLPTDAQSRKAEEKASLLRQVREESARSTATRGDILDRLNAERRAAGKTAIDISAKEFAAEDIAAREKEMETGGGTTTATTSPSVTPFYDSLLKRMEDPGGPTPEEGDFRSKYTPEEREKARQDASKALTPEGRKEEARRKSLLKLAYGERGAPQPTIYKRQG